MGKKSKRKGGGANAKADRKEKLQERREVQLADTNQTSSGFADEYKRPFLDGDRVWCPRTQPNNSSTGRGTIFKIHSDDTADIRVLEGSKSIFAPLDCIFPDFQDHTLRFNVGERVKDRDQNGYDEDHPLPTGPGDIVPCYAVEFKGCVHFVARDNDRYIQSCPLLLRFSVGQKVVFNLDKAVANKKLTVTSPWQRATITRCELGLSYYAVYECKSIVNGITYTFHILKDDDEHIAGGDADPRSRLSDAIEQDCDREHLIDLVTTFEIDVNTFRDFIVNKAIESGSYNALAWLQHDCNIDVLSIKDDEGNNILHKIASSSNATRFIRKAGELSLALGYKEGKLGLATGVNELTNALNNRGENWLQFLVRCGDVKALDAALSPNGGFAWELTNELAFDKNRFSLLADSIKESGNATMQCIFDSFVSLRSLSQQVNTFQRAYKELEEDILSVFPGEDALYHAKHLARFYLDWREHAGGHLVSNPFLNIPSKGYSRLFSLLYDANSSLFLGKTYRLWSNDDRGEYLQPELPSDRATSYNPIEGDLLLACIAGVGSPPTENHISIYEQGKYLRTVWEHVKCDPKVCPSLHYHLKKMEHYYNGDQEYDERQDFWTRKIGLLEDDKNLEGRIKILEYLLQHLPNFKLNALDALRHRQCGVLRFMATKGLLQLDAKAYKNELFARYAPKLQFLDNGVIPKSMTTKALLCFSAVQCDDLQSLIWMCESSGAPVDTCNGWNLLHFSAFTGRIEIVTFLTSLPTWEEFVSEGCHREPFQNAFAVHIAASCGHIMLADFLLALNVTQEDKKGRLPEHYAKKSQHKYVQVWASDRDKPRVLVNNIKKLLEHIDSNDVPADKSKKLKQLIITSGCLDFPSWYDCGFRYFDSPGPTGHSFADILHECCSSFRDRDFILWLCSRLYFSTKEGYYSSRDFWKSNRAGVKRLTKDELIGVAERFEYGDLLEYLPQKWLRRVSFPDPITENLMLVSALKDDDDILQEARAKILHITALLEINNSSRIAMDDLIKRGGKPKELHRLLCTNSNVREILIEEGSKDSNSGLEVSGLLSSYEARQNDISTLCAYGSEYRNGHPLLKLLPFSGFSGRTNISKLHIILATEGYQDLMRYCLENIPGWTVDMELEAVRVASFFGHSTIVDIFVRSKSSNLTFLSGESDRTRAAILGAGESFRCLDLLDLVKTWGVPRDPVKNGRRSEHDSNEQTSRDHLYKSLLCSVLYGYARESSLDDGRHELKTLQVLVDQLHYTRDQIIYAIELLLATGYGVNWVGAIVDLTINISKQMCLEPTLHHLSIQCLCKNIVNVCEIHSGEKNEEQMCSERKIIAWLGDMVTQGIDVQNLASHGEYRVIDESKDTILYEYHRLEEQQLLNWSKFDIVKNDGSLEQIQALIDQGIITTSSRDRGGLLLTHLSAAYNRIDLLEWLVGTKGVGLNERDGQGRTALDVALAARAVATTKWIIERQAGMLIVRFARRHYHRMLIVRTRNRLANASTFIQKRCRGYLVRKLYVGTIMHRLEESQRFSAVWGGLLKFIPSVSSNDWSSVRESIFDIAQADFTYDESYFGETDERLSKALEGALQLQDDHNEMVGDEGTQEELTESNEVVSNNTTTYSDASNASWLKFQVTSHVVKFLKQGDSKYKSFFVRRMQQLANGDRSRILQKRLKGSNSIIYETYLEQKSGFRILWTEAREGTSSNNIVIWFVAKHKEVSRLMKLIDDSKSRSARQQIPESLVSELQEQAKSKQEVLLDVFGNVPLKVYDLTYDNLDEVSMDKWTPSLHLNEEERGIVEAPGTNLVLGRSGTGKTCCICNKIEYDRQKFGNDPTFSQLFVARSKRLCVYVAETVGKSDQSTFCTFTELLTDLETALAGSSKSFLPSQRVDFPRFKQEFYSTHSSGDDRAGALVVWTVFRTFIKGSIEAFEQSPDGNLPVDFFVAEEKLGKKRCKVPIELRNWMYDLFLKYEQYKTQQSLWDDCDRVTELLLRLNETRNSDSLTFQQHMHSKVYIDECQDYTQQEILLFFYLGGPGGLMFAGDGAQSVVLGSSFRFEDIRSVGYFVAGSERRDLIPPKAKNLYINFRSHSGVLNVAGAFLDLLFNYFPDSAKQLKKDQGVFQGSRPGVLYKLQVTQLTKLLSEKMKGTVILVHDGSAHYWRKTLSYGLVMGIREAKGLEFKSVIMLDFFREIPSSIQKPWRNLLLNREGSDFETKHPLVAAYIKLLYTGITRCIERLFFVETTSSIAGETAVRWLTTSSIKKVDSHLGVLATRSNINDIEAMSLTSDEFVVEGFNNAELAELSDASLEQSLIAVDRAIYCFEQAHNSELAKKARTHRRSIQFRRDLLELGDDQDERDKALIERRGAQLMEALMNESLLLEVMNMFFSISPLLSSYAKEELEKTLISKLRLAIQ